MPIAGDVVKGATDLAKSVVAQTFDALRTPLLGWERTEWKPKKHGGVTTVSKANVPAWGLIVGGLGLYVAYTLERNREENKDKEGKRTRWSGTVFDWLMYGAPPWP